MLSNSSFWKGKSKANAPNSIVFFPSLKFDVVALATSAGGLAALSQILCDLPVDFPAAILIVQHLDPRSTCLLPRILTRRTSLPVKLAEHGEIIKSGMVYIAPPDRHLLLTMNGTLGLTQTERVNFSRPAADVLFKSIATCCQKRAIAVVLTGNGEDGAAGIKAVKQMGGRVIVQDPNTAQFPGMPTAAIQTQHVDWVLPLAQIAVNLITLLNS